MRSRKEFYKSGLTIALIAGLFFALSGACTGFYAWQAEFGTPIEYGLNHWYEALFIGSTGLLPTGLLMWAGLRGMKHGANIDSAITCLLVSLPLIVFSLLALKNLSHDITTVKELPIGIVLVLISILAFGVLLALSGIRMLRQQQSEKVKRSSHE